MVEASYLPRQLAQIVGYPESAIRAYCKRTVNPLPHTRSGHKRPWIRITLSDWEEFIAKEKVR